VRARRVSHCRRWAPSTSLEWSMFVASLETEDGRSPSASFGACSRARGAIADKAASPGAWEFFQILDNTTSSSV